MAKAGKRVKAYVLIETSAGKAKAVISIFCYGGVSHVDTFDPKPLLLERQGEALTGKGEVVVSQGHPGGLMPSPQAWTALSFRLIMPTLNRAGPLILPIIRSLPTPPEPRAISG
uniref:DUF1501 domain-containing protein n=1 Tax=Desulfobacca acetoxidans TaxID=60893 RepID=A0A7V4G998_9BACT